MPDIEHPDGLRELWIGTHMSGEVAVTERRREAEVWDRAGWRVEGPFVHADRQAAGEGTVEELREALWAIYGLTPDDLRADLHRPRRIARAALRIGEGGGCELSAEEAAKYGRTGEGARWPVVMGDIERSGNVADRYIAHLREGRGHGDCRRQVGPGRYVCGFRLDYEASRQQREGAVEAERDRYREALETIASDWTDGGSEDFAGRIASDALQGGG